MFGVLAFQNFRFFFALNFPLFSSSFLSFNDFVPFRINPDEKKERNPPLLVFKMNFTWLNEPKKWASSESVIDVHTDGNTDFWRKTHYGFERDSGHFYYRSLPSDQDFTASVDIRGKYQTLYDQGGLMLRVDEKNWIKTGIEFVEGKQYASVVVTVNGWSDWSIVPVASPEVLKLRVKREKEAVHIEFAEGEEGEFKMMRLAYFPEVDKSRSLMVGLMCASPGETAPGFDIRFEHLAITAIH